jgi:hypothetical protein
MVQECPKRQMNRRMFKERRKQPTAALSRFTLWGQRTTFRRKEDRQRGGYVDRYPSLLLFILTMVVGLNILDAWFTMMILENGGWEINPVVRSVIELYGDRFWVWKYAIVSLPLVLLCLCSKFRLVIPIILGLSAINIIVILYQILLIIH